MPTHDLFEAAPSPLSPPRGAEAFKEKASGTDNDEIGEAVLLARHSEREESASATDNDEEAGNSATEGAPTLSHASQVCLAGRCAVVGSSARPRATWATRSRRPRAADDTFDMQTLDLAKSVVVAAHRKAQARGCHLNQSDLMNEMSFTSDVEAIAFMKYLVQALEEVGTELCAASAEQREQNG